MTARELAWRYTHPDADRVRPSPTCHRTYRSGSVRYAQEASGHHLHGWCRVLQGAPDPLATTRARTSNSLATSDTPAVAVTATSAQAGRPASAHTVTSKRRPSRPPSKKPILRSGAGGNPTAAIRSFVAIDNREAAVAATARITPADADTIPSPIAQTDRPATIAASVRRSSTPSSSAPRGVARSCNL